MGEAYINRQVNRDPRTRTRLADDFTIPAHRAGAFLNTTQSKMFPALAARQCDGRVKPAAFVTYYQVNFIIRNSQAQARGVSA
jgi:hypothetical protein